jgi:hypothetical protein
MTAAASHSAAAGARDMTAAASHSAAAGTRDTIAATRHCHSAPRHHPMTHPNLMAATQRGTLIP